MLSFDGGEIEEEERFFLGAESDLDYGVGWNVGFLVVIDVNSSNRLYDKIKEFQI